MFENKFSKKHILYRFEPDAVRGLVLLTFSSSTLYSQNNKLTQADNEWPGIIRVNDLITMTFIWKAGLAWWRMPKEALRKLRCVKCGFSTFQATLRKINFDSDKERCIDEWWTWNSAYCWSAVANPGALKPQQTCTQTLKPLLNLSTPLTFAMCVNRKNHSML